MSDWNTPQPDDKSEPGVEPQAPGDPPLGDDATPPWTDPPTVEPVTVETDAALPPEVPAYEPAPTVESSIPERYHDAAETPAEAAAEAEASAEVESWFNPPPVEPEPVEAHEPPMPEHLHEQTIGDIGGGVNYRDPRHAMDEVAFPLDGFADERRTHLLARLAESNTPVRLEGDTLYGRIDDAGLIEGYILDLSGSGDVEEVIAEADEEDDEIVFDLSTLATEERRHLSMRLTGAGISHIWEVATDLVVSVTDAPAVERYIEEVRNPDGFGDEEMASFEEDDDVDDEEVYAAMSNLYVAADKLMQRPGDDATAGEFYVAVDDVDGLPAPFGFDPRVWSQVQDLAIKIADTLDEEGDTEVIGTDARTLRQLLANYV